MVPLAAYSVSSLIYSEKPEPTKTTHLTLQPNHAKLIKYRFDNPATILQLLFLYQTSLSINLKKNINTYDQ